MIEPFLLGALCGATVVVVMGCIAHVMWRATGPMIRPAPPPVAPLPNFVTATEVRERLRELDAMTFPAQSSMPGSISYLVRSV